MSFLCLFVSQGMSPHHSDHMKGSKYLIMLYGSVFQNALLVVIQ